MGFINSPIGWITIAGVGAVVGMFIYEFFIRKSTAAFEASNLEEMVTDDLDELLKKHGQFSSVNVRRGLRRIGRAHVFERVPVGTSDIDEEEIEEGATPSLEHRVLLVVRPSGFFSGNIWKMMSFFGYGRRMEDIYIVPRASVTMTDAIELDEDLKLTKFGGVWISKDDESYNVVEEVVLKELLKDNLERDSDWIKHMNWKDREHSKRLQNMEKENELKSRYFESRTESAVTQS